MRSTPAHKQTDPASCPGQINNPIPAGHTFNHDMMDDQSMYAFMNRKPQQGTVGEYARRKMDAFVGSIETPEAEAKSFTEFRNRVNGNIQAAIDNRFAMAVSAEEKQALLDADAFKPGRDLPRGWDHV